MSFQQKKARPAVYELAHRALPQMAFSDPKLTRTVLDTASQRWLTDLWARVNARLANEGHPPVPWSPQPAVKVPTRAGDLYFVHPPTAEGFAECVWVAFFFYASAAPDSPPDRQLGYFTLELGFDGDGKPYDLLCSWTAAKNHLNSGTTLGSRDVQWGAQSILEWLARPKVAANTQK